MHQVTENEKVIEKLRRENEKQASELEAIRKGEEAREANLRNAELEKEGSESFDWERIFN